jgi:translation initiation factor 1
MSDEKSKLVYSTDRPVSRKEGLEKDSVRPTTAQSSAKSSVRRGGGVIVRLERKHRGGKSVTVIEGLPISEKDKEELLKQLKTALGTGGTLRDTSLEIQGDHCDALLGTLKKMGYSPKRSGG